MQYDTRKEMKALLNQNLCDEKLEKIIIPNAEISNPSSSFRFVEENEIMYHGKLYDVAKKKVEGNNTIFYCINDKNEESLFKGLEEHLKHNLDQNTPSKDKSNLLAKNIIKEAIPGKLHLLKFNTALSDIPIIYTSLLQEEYIPIFLPPPKI